MAKKIFLGTFLFITTALLAQPEWNSTDNCIEEEDLQLVIKALGPGELDPVPLKAHITNICQTLYFTFAKNEVKVNDIFTIKLEQVQGYDRIVIIGPSGKTTTYIEEVEMEANNMTQAMDDFYNLHSSSFMNKSETFVLNWLTIRSAEPPGDDEVITRVIEAIFYFCNEPNISKADLLEFKQRMIELNTLIPESTIPTE